MANPARIIDACNAVTGAIQSVWNPVAPSAVQRSYVPDIGLSADHTDTLIQGRQVYVFPAKWENDGAIDRGNWDRLYVVQFVTVERYSVSGTDQVGTPTDDWVDQRVLFVEGIFNFLANPDVTIPGALVNLYRLPEDQASVDEVYDVDLLMRKKTFWSPATIAFREIVGLTGA